VQYTLIYDAATAPFSFPSECLYGLIPIALGLAVLRSPSAWFAQFPRFGRFFGFLLVAFGVILLFGVAAAAWSGYADLRRGLKNNSYALVEGTVSTFIPGQPNGHPMERFSVAGHEYAYSPYTSPGFNTISTQGGPMRAGLRVRIADVHGNIARLEIAR
jgi:hypothetical protein